MSETEKYEPMSLEDYQLDESDYDESDLIEEEGDMEVEAEEEEEQVFEEDNEETYVDENEEQQFEEEQQETEFEQQQTPEQNAYYAEQRRQNLVEQRVQQELERVRQQSPEFQMAQMLSEMYGMPVEQLYQQLQEAAIAKKAEEQGVPIEVMRQLNAYEKQQAELQEQLNFMQFQNWNNRVSEEAKQMQNQYPMLNEQDIEQAKLYLLETLQNPEIPLQNAIFALHGDKIANSLKELAKQEAMAEISGRKKGGLPPQSMKTSDRQTLSDEERYVAKMMGISEDDYIKYKS